MESMVNNAWDQLTKEEQEIVAPKLNRFEVPTGGSQTTTETPEQAFNRMFTGQNAEETAALVTGLKNFIDGAGGHSNSEVWQQVGANSLQCSGAGCNATDNNGNLRKQQL